MHMTILPEMARGGKRVFRILNFTLAANRGFMLKMYGSLFPHLHGVFNEESDNLSGGRSLRRRPRRMRLDQHKRKRVVEWRLQLGQLHRHLQPLQPGQHPDGHFIRIGRIGQ